MIIQPPEQVKVPLDEYFRGQNLTYQMSLTKEDGFKVELDKDIFKITEGIQEHHFVDFEQRAEEQSLTQTSVLVTDEYANKYLVFIDFYMYLNVYNLSQYYMTGSTAQNIPRILRLDLYAKDQLLSKDRQCNNLVQIDKFILLANCKGDVNSIEPMSVLVEIDLKDLKKPKIFYQLNAIDFEQMKDGNVELLQKQGEKYHLIVKQNTTNCYIEFGTYQRSSLYIFGNRIYDFQDPAFPHQETNKSKFFQSCQIPAVIDYDAPYIDYLQIKSVSRVDYFPNVMVASDYNYGLLFWGYDCELPKTKCEEIPLYRLQLRHAGSIYVLEQDNFRGEQVLFVQVMNPPQIYEVNLVLDSRPFIAKQYKLPQDVNEYISINNIGGNSEYLFACFLSVKTFKPVIRIYKRQASFFSIVHTQIELDEFLDSGVFYSFIRPNDNFLLVKTSDYFRIYKLDQVELIIDARNISKIEQYLDSPLQLNLNVKNYTSSRMTTSIDMLFVERTKMTSYAIYEGTKRQNQSLGYKISYSCGNPTAKLNVDKFFSGPNDEVTLVSDNNSKDYFTLNQRRIGANFTLIDFKIKDCNLNQIVKLSQGEHYGNKRYLGCVKYNSSSITLIDIFSNLQTQEEMIKAQFELPNARIVEFHVDENEKTLLLFSDQTVEGESGAVIHFFRLFNVLTWDFSLDLNKNYPKELINFNFRQHDPISLSSTFQLGIIISEPKLITGSKLYQTQILVFDLLNQQYSSLFNFKGVINVQTPINSKDQVEVVQTRFSTDHVWILLSNNTFFVYQMKNLNANQKDARPMIRLYRVLIFDESDPALTGNIFNFKIKGSHLICFFKDKNIAIYQYEKSTLDLQQVMILPLYLPNFSDTDFKYVISSIKQRIVFEVLDNFLVVLYEKWFMNQFDGYTVFIYNLLESRHNSMMGKFDIPGQIDEIDPSIVRIHLFQIEDDQIRVIIVSQETLLVYFDVQLYTELLINKNALAKLNNFCLAYGSIQLNYTLYPTDNPLEKVQVTLNAKNDGLLIYKQAENQNITVSLERTNLNQKRVLTPDIVSTKYQMLQNFHGQNIEYDLKCKQNKDTDNNMCKEMHIPERVLDFNRSIEFLSSTNQLCGYFVIEPVILFFDSQYIRVYFPDTQQYISRNIYEIYYKMFGMPYEYFMFNFEFDNKEKINYLGSINNLYQFTLTKILKSKPDFIVAKKAREFLNIGDEIYIMPSGTSIYLPTKISNIELYCKGKDRFVGIFVFDSEFVTTQSAIQFYDIDIQDESEVKYSLLNGKILSANNLNLDSFKITAIKLYGKSHLLLLAIENFGVMIYDLKKFEIVQVISVKPIIPSRFFAISNIIFESQINVKLLIPQQGVFTLTFSDEKLNTQPSFKSIFFEPSLALTFKQNTVSGLSGFTYMQATENKKNGTTQAHLRFYSWDSLKNSKSLGTHRVATTTDQKCRYLQEISYSYARDYFMLKSSIDYQCVSLVCGAAMKIVCFNFHPTLRIVPKDTYTQEINSQQVQIIGSNEFSKESLNMTIVILKQSRAVDPGYYIAILVVLGLLLLFLFRKQKASAEIKIEKKIKEQSKRISRGYLTEYFSSQNSTVKAQKKGEAEQNLDKDVK